jgi:hypothetical protein
MIVCFYTLRGAARKRGESMLSGILCVLLCDACADAVFSGPGVLCIIPAWKCYIFLLFILLGRVLSIRKSFVG